MSSHTTFGIISPKDAETKTQITWVQGHYIKGYRNTDNRAFSKKITTKKHKLAVNVFS